MTPKDEDNQAECPYAGECPSYANMRDSIEAARLQSGNVDRGLASDIDGLRSEMAVLSQRISNRMALAETESARIASHQLRITKDNNHTDLSSRVEHLENEQSKIVALFKEQALLLRKLAQ